MENKLNPIYLIYRNRENNTIEKYSILKIIPPDLDKHIFLFNNKNQYSIAEKTTNLDFISLINIAERKEKIKESDLKDIEHAIDNLQTEIYQLKERL